MARKHPNKTQHDDDDAPPPAAPSVGTSLKGLLKGLSLGKDDRSASKASGGSDKASGGPNKASGGPNKASGGPNKPSGPSHKNTEHVLKGEAKPKTAPATEPARPTGTEVVARPSDGLRGDDRIAFFDAIAGVRTLDAGRPKPKRAVPVKTTAAPTISREAVDAPARKKLGELVGGAHQFDVAVEDDGFVEGLRRDAPIEALGALRREQPRIDATLDLHGLREAVVEDRLARWLREQHRKGVRRVLVVHGKGLHSDDGVAVLREAVIRVLEASIATPLVLAFSSAPPSMGGTGAMLVELTKERLSR
ncbi:MAG: Smr/MutS family protein [Sandaracinaceae bacterium]|nr:Smr/MutS family protein [Sandaracinaceae bacterium]